MTPKHIPPQSYIRSPENAHLPGVKEKKVALGEGLLGGLENYYRLFGLLASNERHVTANSEDPTEGRLLEVSVFLDFCGALSKLAETPELGYTICTRAARQFKGFDDIYMAKPHT